MISPHNIRICGSKRFVVSHRKSKVENSKPGFLFSKSDIKAVSFGIWPYSACTTVLVAYRKTLLRRRSPASNYVFILISFHHCIFWFYSQITVFEANKSTGNWRSSSKNTACTTSIATRWNLRTKNTKYYRLIRMSLKANCGVLSKWFKEKIISYLFYFFTFN